jgi:hypothetical protein
MDTVASILFRLWARIAGHRVIELIGQPRPGNHVFVSSRDLPGFSFMLRPGEHEDATSAMAALNEPLKAFLMAEFKASQKNERAVRVTAVRQTSPVSYLAEWCTA